MNIWPPYSHPDTLCAYWGDTAIVAPLLNDWSDVGDSLSNGIVSTPANGSAGIQSSNTLWLLPDSGFVGTDSMQYSACGWSTFCDTGWVVMHVRPDSIQCALIDAVAPIAQPDTICTYWNDTATVAPLLNDWADNSK